VQRGVGDLRLYLWVQFGALIIVVLLMVLYRPKYRGSRYMASAVGVYALSQLFDGLDKQIHALGGIISGHTLKHLAAAAGVYCVIVMLRARR
jgi:hypothetical protein